jgi:hypothetical protein
VCSWTPAIGLAFVAVGYGILDSHGRGVRVPFKNTPLTYWTREKMQHKGFFSLLELPLYRSLQEVSAVSFSRSQDASITRDVHQAHEFDLTDTPDADFEHLQLQPSPDLSDLQL